MRSADFEHAGPGMPGVLTGTLNTLAGIKT